MKKSYFKIGDSIDLFVLFSFLLGIYSVLQFDTHNPQETNGPLLLFIAQFSKYKFIILILLSTFITNYLNGWYQNKKNELFIRYLIGDTRKHIVLSGLIRYLSILVISNLFISFTINHALNFMPNLIFPNAIILFNIIIFSIYSYRLVLKK